MKKLFSSIVIGSLIVLLSGCTEDMLQPLTPTEHSKSVYIPELGLTTKTEIGQNMYSKVYAVYKYDYKAVFDSKDKNKVLTMAYPYESENNKNKNLYVYKQDNNCILPNYNDFPLLVDQGCKGEFTEQYTPSYVVTYVKVKLQEPIKYQMVPNKTPSKILEDSIKYVVLYQGKVGNIINVTFQEFIASYNSYTYERTFMIRDAFTQTIQYELDEKGEALIGFKGLRIKVLKATNLDIEYQVIKDFD